LSDVTEPIAESDATAESAAGHDHPPAPPHPPRAVTPRVRRRAWAEPRVRAVALCAAAALAVSAYFFVSRYVEWRREAWLVTKGTPVDAVVTEAGGITLANKVVPPTTPVTMEYTVGGNKLTVQGTLKGRKEHILTGGTVPLRVDPSDPSVWTSLTTPRPLRMELLGGLIVLPFALVLGIVALTLHRRLLSLWRDGDATAAVVIDSTHTAVAPRTHFVRCTPMDSADKRMLAAYFPRTRPKPQSGEAVWLIAKPAPSTRAVGAEWFEH
jgi:hypothetical protein